MTVTTDYPFLAHPPPSPSRTPRRRSSTFSSIAAWAAHVQPGSPASLSPRSPRRRHSLSRRRRSSVASICAASTSFIHVAPTPPTHLTTPSVRDFEADLTTVGYSSVFLQLPNTPISATLSISVKPAKSRAGGFASFRSLSVLRPGRRSKSLCPDTPTKRMKSTNAPASVVVKRKKSKYAALPPPLANELAVMQFLDGGNTEDNIRRATASRAKAAGAAGLADVHRDGKGGVWLDHDEEWEYAHLLADPDEPAPRAAGDVQWVTFGGEISHATACMHGEERRGSLSTQHSHIDPKHIVQPPDLLYGDHNLAQLGGTIFPTATRKHAPVLSIPCRPRRTAKHLRQPEFLVEQARFPHASIESPPSTGLRGKARRRPAPLKLCPQPFDVDGARRDFLEASFEPAGSITMATPTPVTAVRSGGTAVPVPVDVLRGKLVGNGKGRTSRVPWGTVEKSSVSLGTKKKPSMLNVMALFRSSVN